jgi:beta-galactosidase
VFDVMADDDYSHSGGDATLAAPIAGVPYLVTEAVGALDGPPGYRHIDIQPVQQAQARLHAQVHNVAGGNDAYCGLLGWCAFDYDSLAGYTFQSMKWPGVADTFRIPKPGAAFYQAQVSPSVRPVIAPAFYWDFGPVSPVTSLGTQAMIWSNCDRLEAYLDGVHYASLTPDAATYPHVAYPPCYLDTTGIDATTLPELRLDGYVGARLVLSRRFAADPAGDGLAVWTDDAELVADGSDVTRVGFRAVDRYGAPRPYAEGQVAIAVDGPGTSARCPESPARLRSGRAIRSWDRARCASRPSARRARTCGRARRPRRYSPTPRCRCRRRPGGVLRRCPGDPGATSAPAARRRTGGGSPRRPRSRRGSRPR